MNFLKPTLLLTLVFALASPPQASAMSMGDAALTVTVSTVAGAVLGASTLPFYEESGKHSKNIFYGAALGAVVGVMLSAYSGVQENSGVDEEEALAKKKPRPLAQNGLLKPESTTALQKHSVVPESQPVFWTALADLRF